MGVNGGINLYRYAVNSPVAMQDPFGLSPDWFNALTGTVSDLASWVRGSGTKITHVEDAMTGQLSRTPAMNTIRGQFKQDGCRSGDKYYCGDFQYRELFTTINLTGQTVGSFCAKITPVGNGRILVQAQNTWGLESGTRFPGTSNRQNPSLQDMLLHDAPFTYPKSTFNNKATGAFKNQTVYYIWQEKSRCCE
jgi:hypothetical protein